MGKIINYFYIHIECDNNTDQFRSFSYLDVYPAVPDWKGWTQDDVHNDRLILMGLCHIHRQWKAEIRIQILIFLG